MALESGIGPIFIAVVDALVGVWSWDNYGYG